MKIILLFYSLISLHINLLGCDNLIVNQKNIFVFFNEKFEITSNITNPNHISWKVLDNNFNEIFNSNEVLTLTLQIDIPGQYYAICYDNRNGIQKSDTCYITILPYQLRIIPNSLQINPKIKIGDNSSNFEFIMEFISYKKHEYNFNLLEIIPVGVDLNFNSSIGSR